MSVRGLSIEATRFEVVHAFDGDTPSETVLVAMLAQGAAAHAAGMLDRLGDAVGEPVIQGRDGLEVHLPPVEDPSSIEPKLAALAEAIRRLAPGEHSPYR